MEHPLINDADSLSLEDLQSRISNLQKKFAWAQRHNAHLAQQIGMALETYTNKYQQRQEEIWKAGQKNGPDYSDRIDIS